MGNGKKIETKEKDRLSKWDAEDEFFKGMCLKIEHDLREVSKSVELGIAFLLKNHSFISIDNKTSLIK